MSELTHVPGRARHPAAQAGATADAGPTPGKRTLAEHCGPAAIGSAPIDRDRVARRAGKTVKGRGFTYLVQPDGSFRVTGTPPQFASSIDTVIAPTHPIWQALATSVLADEALALEPVDDPAAAVWPALCAAADVLQYGQHRLIDLVDPRYRPAVESLYAAVIGEALDPQQRLDLIERSVAALRPAIALADDPAWVRAWITPPLERIRDKLEAAINDRKANRRVANAITLADGTVVELDRADPALQARVLRELVGKLGDTVRILLERGIRLGDVMFVNEQVIRAGEGKAVRAPGSSIVKQVDPAAPVDGSAHGGHGHGAVTGTLSQVQGVLFLIDGFLTLSDDELVHHVAEIDALVQTRVATGREVPGLRAKEVATYAHLVKAMIELVGGLVSTVATAAYALTRAHMAWLAAKGVGVGPTQAALDLAQLGKDGSELLQLARASAAFLANAIAVVEIIHGVAVLLDPDATADQTWDAWVGIATGVAWFARGGAAPFAVWAGMQEVKTFIKLHASTRRDLVAAWMLTAFETIQIHGRALGERVDALHRCTALLDDEHDPAQRDALTRLQTDLARQLGFAIDDFITACEPRGYGTGGKYPGAYNSLRRVFAPVMQLAGKHAPDEVGAAAVILERIAFCFAHAPELLVEELGAHRPPGARDAAADPSPDAAPSPVPVPVPTPTPSST